MNNLVKGICLSQHAVISRSLCCTPSMYIKQWRIEHGLSVNRTAEGILTDGPDYTFLDGRPTPLLQKQKKRMLKQQDYATKIVTLCSEIDFAKKRYQDMLNAKEEERRKIISNRLKPKGRALSK
ncbi:unnamed protein product, partial [Brenthis ino]